MNIAEPLPTQAEVEAMGFTLADYDDDYFDVWPENWPAVGLFRSICNQWRTAGMGGVLGLDYTVLFHRLDRMNLSDEEYELLFADVRAIESGALSVINKKTT